MILNIDMNEFSISSINDNIYVKETNGFTTVSVLFTLHVTIHSLRTIDWNANRDVKVDYDVILYEVQTSDFLHIAIKSLGKP